YIEFFSGFLGNLHEGANRPVVQKRIAPCLSDEGLDSKHTRTAMKQRSVPHSFRRETYFAVEKCAFQADLPGRAPSPCISQRKKLCILGCAGHSIQCVSNS